MREASQLKVVSPAPRNRPMFRNKGGMESRGGDLGPRRFLSLEALNRPLRHLRSHPKLSRAVTALQAGFAKKFLKKKKPDPKVVRESANELYKSMHSGLFGMGTDEERLYKALKDKTPEEIAAIKKEYKDHYDRDLNADLKDELSGSEYKRAQALMSSKKEAADADAIYQAVDGAGTNENLVMDTLKNKSPREIRKLKYEYQKRYGRSLVADLEDDLSGRELDQARALLNSDKAGSAVAQLRMAMDGGGTDEAKVYGILEGASPRERRAIKKAYFEKTGRRLDDTLESEFSGAELNRARAGLKGDKAGVSAARLDEAMRGLGTNEDEIYRVLEGKSGKERAAILRAYQRQTGRNLSGSLKSEMSGNDLDQASSLLHDGRLTAAERIHFATDRAGTDEDAIRAALKGKSSEEISAIRREYKQRYGKNLDTVLDSELSGREAFEVSLDLRGKPKNALEALQRANARYHFERGGSSNSLGAGLLDFTSDSGKNLDRNHRRANEFAEEALSDGVLTRAESRRLQQLTGFQSDDVEFYQETKDSVAEAVGDGAATLAALGATVATGGAALPVIMGASAAAGATAKVAFTGAISGRSYGTEQMLMDAGVGAIDGVSFKASSMAGKAARKIAQRRTQGQLRRRITGMVAEGVADGAVDGAITGAGRTAFTDGTWDQGLDHGLGRVFNGALHTSLEDAALGPFHEFLGQAATPLLDRGGDVFRRLSKPFARLIRR